MNALVKRMNDTTAGMQTATGRDVRNLASLGETASTSRVLNLSQIYLSSSKDKDYLMKPFFKDSQMNKAILVKHTLRSNERMLFSRHRRTATKVILPFDPNDLKLGGRSVFVNQIGFENFARSYFNTDDFNQNYDVQVLKLIDVLPSLDPFLVREHLSRSGYKPGSCYLKISPVDVQQMIGFANAEIERLVITAFGEALQYRSVKLAGKILSNELDKELWPLKATLRMTDEEFSDGIFSWRGFLYYKWRYIELQEEMRKVLEGLANYQPYNTSEDGVKEYLKESRPRLARRIAGAITMVGRTLAIYDQAYAALVEQQNPGPFRHFLMDGPSLFYELGENIGILGHIGSFWKYRMTQSGPQVRLSAPEYADMIMDFEDSLLNISQPDSVAF